MKLLHETWTKYQQQGVESVQSKSDALQNDPGVEEASSPNEMAAVLASSESLGGESAPDSVSCVSPSWSRVCTHTETKLSDDGCSGGKAVWLMGPLRSDGFLVTNAPQSSLLVTVLVSGWRMLGRDAERFCLLDGSNRGELVGDLEDGVSGASFCV